MDDSLQNETLLVRYLDGELSEEETARLESRLQTDAALRAELHTLQVAIQSVKHYGLSQKVGSIHTEMMRELKAAKKKNRAVPFGRSVRYTLAVAASVVALWIGIRFFTAPQPSADSVFNEVFVDFPVSSSRSSDARLSAIETHYRQKNYQAIINSSRSMHMDAKDSLLTGLAYLQTGRAAQATGFFQRMTAYENNWQQDAEFYLALSLLKSRQYQRALPLLEKIAGNSSHLYHSRITADVVENVRDLQEE